MKSRLFLDVVVGQGAAVLELLASKDQALLIWRNTFLVLTEVSKVGITQHRRCEHTLNLRLDIVDGIGGFNLESDGLTREGLDKNLHDGLG